jgi:hypothetical protein
MAVKERISLMATSDSDLFLADSDFDDSVTPKYEIQQ